MLGWSPVSPSGQQLAYGHISMNCDVVVSGGLGCSILPFRLGVPPEVVLVTLGAARPAVA
jgi:predicted MPP superfamily phosphohydrolase